MKKKKLSEYSPVISSSFSASTTSSSHHPPSSSSSSSSSASSMIKIILKPNQSFDTTFEYSSKHLTLQIIEFTSLTSPLFLAGGRVGMILLSMNQIQFQSLPQDDIIFILTSKKHLLREILLSEPIKSAENGRNLPKLKNKLEGKNHSGEGISSSSSLNALSSSTTLSSQLPSPPISQSEHIIRNQPASSYLTNPPLHPHQASRSNLSSKPPRSISSQTSGDPFSTPARRRRLVADIARFLLKQYCIKACEHVAYHRFYLECVIRIQCWIRQYLALKQLKTLRHLHYTKNCLVIQRYYRCVLARDQLNERIKLRYKLKYYAMVLRVQAKYRQFHCTRRYQSMMDSSRRIQNIIRSYLAKKLVQRKKAEKLHRIRLERISAETIQCSFRRYQAKKKYLELYGQYCKKRVMKYRILVHWRRYYHQKKFSACLLIQSQMRIFLSKKVYADKKFKRTLEGNENLLMSREDVRSRYIHEHTVDISLTLLVDRSLTSLLCGMPIMPFLHWCIRHHLLVFHEEIDTYLIGNMIQNLLGHWHQSQKSSRDRIEIPNSSLQDNLLSNDLLYPDELQCPSGWSRRYPPLLTPRNQRCFRVRENRWGQIILHFENFLSWNELCGDITSKLKDEGKIYHLEIKFGERDVRRDMTKAIASAAPNQGSSVIPEFDLRDLEVMISYTSTSSNSEGSSRQLVCRIESDVKTEHPSQTDPQELSVLQISGDSSPHVVDNMKDNDENVIHEDDDIISDDDDASHAMPESLLDDNLVVDIALKEQIKSLSISRPTTATTRLFITREPPLTEEQMLENYLKEWKMKIRSVHPEMLLRVTSRTVRMRDVQLNQLYRRIMILRIQRAQRYRQCYLIQKRAVMTIQQFFRRARNLKCLQNIVYSVIEKMHLVTRFLQQTGRLVHAKMIVRRKREEYCENSYEKRQPIVSLITERILAPYSWLNSSEFERQGFDEEDEAMTLKRIANTFRPEISPFTSDSPLPQPPSQETSTSQYFFLPYSSSSENSSQSHQSYVNSSHWAQELFQLLDLPKSTFESSIDLVSSQHILIATSPSSLSDENPQSIIASCSEEWNRGFIPPEMRLQSLGGYGNIQTSKNDDKRINLQKYTRQVSSREEGIPPLFHVIREKYFL